MNKIAYLVTSGVLALQILFGVAHVAADNWPAGHRVASVEEVLRGEQLRQEAKIHFTQFSAGYYRPVQLVHTAARQQIATISANNQEMRLLDGSLWSLGYYDSKIVRYWNEGDNVAILPNHDWFTFTDFKMKNLQTLEEIYVSIEQGPHRGGIYTRLIDTANYYSGQIVLSDGTIWMIPYYSTSTMRYWNSGDNVIVGENNGSDKYDFPNILINVGTREYVEARAY